MAMIVDINEMMAAAPPQFQQDPYMEEMMSEEDEDFNEGHFFEAFLPEGAMPVCLEEPLQEDDDEEEAACHPEEGCERFLDDQEVLSQEEDHEEQEPEASQCLPSPVREHHEAAVAEVVETPVVLSPP